MIYEMVGRFLDELQNRWTLLQDALTKLENALPAPDLSVRPQVETVLSGIPPLLAGIVDPRSDPGDFPDVATLLAKASQILNDSSQFVSTQLLPQLVASGALGLAVGSDDPAVAGAAQGVTARLGELRQHIERCLEQIALINSDAGSRANLSGIRHTVDNLSAYPVLTQETGSTGGSPAAGSSGAGTRSLGAIVENTLRDVLGWRPKKDDSKGFVAALTQSFVGHEVEGRTEYTYTPRTYAVQVQADMGAVTGAQASIYARAKAALDQSTILLDRLFPLDPAADPQNTDADRAITRSDLTELVNELGIEGGPRVLRVDSLFDHLRGADTTFDPEQVQGQLRQLRDDFGLTRDRVTTIEEEQNLTDFITLVDYVNSLFLSWKSQRAFFDRSGTTVPFLGTQLVLVSRELSVVSESVQDAYYALDSVFIGASERQTIPLTFTDGRPPIFVGELLAWADRFATEEGPRLIQDAGKFGVRAFFPTIDTLRLLVRGALVPPQDPFGVPAGYRTARVQRALQELAGHLDDVAALARPFATASRPGGAAARIGTVALPSRNGLGANVPTFTVPGP
jgi:hypothetical protein